MKQRRFLTTIRRGAVALAALFSLTLLGGCALCGFLPSDDASWEHVEAGDGGGYYKRVTALESGDLVVAESTYDGQLLLGRYDETGITRWRRTYGVENAEERSVRILELSDGFLIAGNSRVYGESNLSAYYLVKTDFDGNLHWERRIPDVDHLTTADVVPAGDGFMLLGTTTRIGARGTEFQLLRVNGTGELLWTETYGGRANDRAVDLEATSDGGFALFGEKQAPVGEENYDYYLIKTDAEGVKQWEATFRATDEAGRNDAGGIRQTSDGGYMLVGSGSERSGYLVRVDQHGKRIWDRNLVAMSQNDRIYDLTPAADNGYVLVGRTEQCQFCYFALVVKIDDEGNEVWSRRIGDGDVVGSSITTTRDGNYVIAGSARYGRLFLAELDADGNAKRRVDVLGE